LSPYFDIVVVIAIDIAIVIAFVSLGIDTVNEDVATYGPCASSGGRKRY
jgi:hypothetical protein